MKWVLSRTHRQAQTSGCLYVFDGDHSFFNCLTLELRWLDNKRNVSCYPAGVYDVQKITRPNGKLAFHVLNVPNRSAILFHAGTFATTTKPDTEGCTLVGFRYEDVNKDGLIDITESQKALAMLLDLMPDTPFKLHVL